MFIPRFNFTVLALFGDMETSIPLIMSIVAGIDKFGLFVFLGMIVGLTMTVNSSRWLGMSNWEAFMFALKIILSGLGAGIVLYGLENIGYFALAPHKALYVWNYGMSLWGGIIGGLAALFWGLRRDRVKMWRGATVASWTSLVGIGIGRTGDFISSSSVGTSTDLPWGVVRTDLVNASFIIEPGGTHPVAIYEIVLVFVLLCGLAAVTRLSMPRWGRFVGVLGGYAGGTLIIRMFRSDPGLLGLQSAQWISVGVLMVIGCMLISSHFRSMSQRHEIVNK